MLCSLHDDGQKWPKHVADDKRKHSVLRPVFAPKVNTDLMPNNICFDNKHYFDTYEGWNFNSGNYLFTTDTK